LHHQPVDTTVDLTILLCIASESLWPVAVSFPKATQYHSVCWMAPDPGAPDHWQDRTWNI